MKLKTQLLDVVKQSFPNFNEETDWFVIEFEGAGDSFDSFHSFEIGTESGESIDGRFDLSEHTELLYQIIEASGAEHNWNNAGTVGKIEYNVDEDNPAEALEVKTILTHEDSGMVFNDEPDEDKQWH